MADVSVPFYMSYAALWVLVVLQGLILIGLVRIVYRLQQAGTIVESDEVGLKSGEIVPRFSAIDLSGEAVSSVEFLDHMTALLFVSPDCPSCTATLNDLAYLNIKTQGNVLLICRADPADCRRIADSHNLSVRTIADEDAHITRLFGISSFPTAVLVNERNRIHSFGKPKRSEELNTALEGIADNVDDTVGTEQTISV